MLKMLRELRHANVARAREWPGNDQIDVAFRAIEVAGEAGEVAEAVKKHLRDVRGIAGSVGGIPAIADELADLVIAADLLANDLGIELDGAVASKFNRTSEKYGLSTRISEKSDA